MENSRRIIKTLRLVLKSTGTITLFVIITEIIGIITKYNHIPLWFQFIMFCGAGVLTARIERVLDMFDSK